jgi:hypothetical protein
MAFLTPTTNAPTNPVCPSSMGVLIAMATVYAILMTNAPMSLVHPSSMVVQIVMAMAFPTTKTFALTRWGLRITEDAQDERNQNQN